MCDNPNKDLILVVDDTPRNVQLLGAVLEESGYDIAAAMNGPQALSFLEEELPDLILLDIMMPEMDGYEVCRRIKAEKKTSKIPIIFLTAKTQTEDILEGFKAGAVDYVTKPFETEELMARVNTHIELKKAREELKDLRGIIPICSYCKKVRDDEGYWSSVENFIAKYSSAMLSHGACPTCHAKAMKEVDANGN